MKWLLSVSVFFFASGLGAQDYTYPLEGITKVVITVETDVFVKTHTLNTFLIKASENERDELPQDVKELTSMTNFGTDNTNYGIEVEKAGSLLLVKGLRDRLAADLIIRLPKEMNVSVEILDNNDIYVEGFHSEIEAINPLGEIILMNITGPIVVENTNGNTVVVFSEVSQASPSSIVASNGDIDIKMPADSKVNISSKTPRGDFRTNLDLVLTQKRDKNDYTRSIAGKINGGGVSLDLQNLYGNIYLRKRK